MPKPPKKSQRERRRDNRKWEVSAEGVAQLRTPGMDGAVITLMPSQRLDREIADLTKEQTRITGRIAEIQADLTGVDEELADLTALRATVTAEPPAE